MDENWIKKYFIIRYYCKKCECSVNINKLKEHIRNHWMVNEDG